VISMGSSKKRKGPEFIKYFDPVLSAIRAQGSSARPKEVYDWIISNQNISEAELLKVNKNGQSNFENKVAFARFYLTKAGYIDGSSRGVWALTEKGRTERLTPEMSLAIFDGVQAQWGRKTDAQDFSGPDAIAPDDDAIIEIAEIDPNDFMNLDEVQTRIKDSLLEMSDNGFEEFCGRLLRTIGFENVTIRGGSGDGGIDGYGELLLNRFVRTKVAFQCKKYGDQPVTPDKIRDFRGATTGRVDRGIFMTTSRFTKAASEEARRDNAIPIELVDLQGLIDIVIEERLGVRERKSLDIDVGFFEQYSKPA
jgi:restriction system protein